jgi:LysM repeat protein
MYATGLAIRPLRSRQPSGLRHAGRWLLVALVLVLVSVAMARVAAGGTAPADATVVVQPGETLWSIAAARYPGSDTRERVDAIERLNGLASPRIEVGEVLQLPAP